MFIDAHDPNSSNITAPLSAQYLRNALLLHTTLDAHYAAHHTLHDERLGNAVTQSSALVPMRRHDAALAVGCLCPMGAVGGAPDTTSRHHLACCSTSHLKWHLNELMCAERNFIEKRSESSPHWSRCGDETVSIGFRVISHREDLVASSYRP